MGLKLAFVNSNQSIPRSSLPKPNLILIDGEKNQSSLWPGDQQPIPLPKIIEPAMLCHRCGESEEYVWINAHMIHCYTCSLTSIQKHK